MKALYFKCKFSQETTPKLAAWDFMAVCNRAFGDIDVTNVFSPYSKNIFYAKLEIPDTHLLEGGELSPATINLLKDIRHELKDEKSFIGVLRQQSHEILNLFARAQREQEALAEQKEQERLSQQYMIVWDAEQSTLTLQSPGTPSKTIEMSKSERYLLNPIIRSLAKESSLCTQEQDRTTLIYSTHGKYEQALEKIQEIDAKLLRFNTRVEQQSSAKTELDSISPLTSQESMDSISTKKLSGRTESAASLSSKQSTVDMKEKLRNSIQSEENENEDEETMRVKYSTKSV